MNRLDIINVIREKYQPLSRVMDERVRRLWAAGEAKALGWGGISLVSTATGLSRTTITTAMNELGALGKAGGLPKQRVRRPGAGRKKITQKYPDIVQDLEELLEPYMRGDPTSPLRWTCKSIRKLTEELNRKGYQIGTTKVCELLHELNYSLQSNRKTKEGGSHPDRNAQFEYIYQLTKEFQSRGQPVISVDAKKKELIGNFRNEGKEWHPKGEPDKVEVYDFPSKAQGKGIPYGVYDTTANQGWVSVGIDHDTAEFAGETISRWWHKMGLAQYREASELLITADGGGSNSSRSRLWKVVLQKLADKTGLVISMCHFPPGTSKWNTIEHRMFSYITQNWRGRPLVSYEVMVNSIASMRTEAGLIVNAELVKNAYPTGIKVSDEELASVNLNKASFHGEWNYQINPREK